MSQSREVTGSLDPPGQTTVMFVSSNKTYGHTLLHIMSLGIGSYI